MLRREAPKPVLAHCNIANPTLNIPLKIESIPKQNLYFVFKHIVSNVLPDLINGFPLIK